MILTVNGTRRDTDQATVADLERYIDEAERERLEAEAVEATLREILADDAEEGEDDG